MAGNKRKRQAGFTIIELMVAMVAGLIVIYGVYYLLASSTRHFHEQQRISQTQMGLRMGMEQLRREIAIAGFGGVPNSNVAKTCQAPAQPVRAIQILDGADTAVLPNAATNGVNADGVRLMGNFVTGEIYMAVGLDAAGDSIRLQSQWQSFRRSFVDPVGGTVDTDLFDNVFADGRRLHIETANGFHFFPTITGTNAATETVDFTPAMPIGTACVGGLADGAMVAPLSHIEYRVVDLAATAAGANLADTFGGPQLVRREITFGATPTVIANSERVVLDNVAHLDFEFLINTTVAAGAPPNFVDATAGQVNAAPQLLRSVTIELAARTPEQDPRFPWVPRAANAPLTRYQLDPDVLGAARVRSATEEVMVRNIASR